MTNQTEHEKESRLTEAPVSGMVPVSTDASGEMPPASGSSQDPAGEVDREWDIPARSTWKTAWKLVLGAAVTGIVATGMCLLAGDVANSFNLSPDQYGVFLALLSGLAGGVIGCLDFRPGRIKVLGTVHDEEAKAIALRAKTDAGWCTVGTAGFGVPAILARIHPPAALSFLPHDVTAGFVAGAIFVLAFGTTISLRTTSAEFARQVLKMAKHNEDLQKKRMAEKKRQEKLEAERNLREKLEAEKE
ncbi:hypothetical protein BLA39750_01049 [Burkholderia lata]|uniref:Uncharacterized protein n=1 Tax=Burkholderia lata (strain ATCC 17760 / DSM 23089 / LMG 22485 / NCIMB 9086 / R18194 / 383) TaxID=482957 RepID=A0A6P2UYC5_BURL3|nr:hypothetical protein [Burkholderia lata]VWC78864.1 hypothetical protein BLA39750_01049 [Burkholderia lata]